MSHEDFLDRKVPLAMRALDPELGDHMTMHEFEQACRGGAFIDYDGHGEYATATQVSNKVIMPSDVTRNAYDRTFTHVVWYNR